MRGGLPIFTAFSPQKVAVEKLDAGGKEEGSKLGMNGIICPAACCFSVYQFLLGMVLLSRKPNKNFLGPNFFDSVNRLSQCIKIASSTFCEFIW